MIEKLKTLEDDEIDMSVGAVNTRFADTELVRKINELCDAVNELQKDREEIKEWIAIVSDLRSRVPVVESRVSILEEHAHPTAKTENSQSAKIVQGFNNLQDHRPNMVMDDPFGPHPNIYEQSMRMDKEFAEDECARLQKELNYTQKALGVAFDALNTIKPKKDVSQGGFWTLSQSDILDVILRAEKEIKRIIKGDDNE
jgi:hypothetical protein